MKQYFNILLICVVSVMGCQTARNLITKSPSNFQSLIACEQATVILTNTDSPNTPSKKYKRSECPECKGKGYIMSGDGLFKQSCPYCEADSQMAASKCGRADCPCQDCKCVNGCKCKIGNECHKMTTTASVSSKCCKDCICPDGKCNCSYPGECLVKRNRGNAVRVCGENGCTTYYPQNATKTQNSTPNAKTTITQPKSQRPAQFGNNAYSSGCSSGGWGTRSSGGRRYGGRGWF